MQLLLKSNTSKNAFYNDGEKCVIFVKKRSMDSHQIEVFNLLHASSSPEKILSAVATIFDGKIAFASSLGFEDQVITHMIREQQLKIDIFTLDTGRLFPETYDLIDRTNARYKTNIKVFFPNAEEIESMVNEKGINLFYESIENRKLCCNLRKTKPLSRALSACDAWITGLRKAQSVTRTGMKVMEWDEVNQCVKINPLIEWSEQQVTDYIRQNNIPYNKLHDQYFPSIGCQPCTRAVSPGEDIRAGRWWWELPDQKECGLHKAKDQKF